MTHPSSSVPVALCSSQLTPTVPNPSHSLPVSARALFWGLLPSSLLNLTPLSDVLNNYLVSSVSPTPPGQGHIVLDSTPHFLPPSTHHPSLHPPHTQHQSRPNSLSAHITPRQLQLPVLWWPPSNLSSQSRTLQPESPSEAPLGARPPSPPSPPVFCIHGYDYGWSDVLCWFYTVYIYITVLLHIIVSSILFILFLPL